MKVIGVHDMLDALASYTRGFLSADGGLSLILMDGLLLVPLGMAVFFYPVVAALIGAVLVAATVGALALSRATFTRPTSPAHPPEVRPGGRTLDSSRGRTCASVMQYKMKTAIASIVAAVAASACCLGPVVFSIVGAGALGATAVALKRGGRYAVEGVGCG